MRLRVLFLSRSNAARSQIAEHLLREMGRGRFEAFSAGSAPRPVNPLAVRVLDEIGIDAHGATSKSIEALKGTRFDYVINICDDSTATCPGARPGCPSFPGQARKGCWGFGQKPAEDSDDEAKLAYLSKVREQITNRLRIWMAAVDKPVAGAT
jgi:arsenate reductase (thioredoxin)